MVLFATTCSYPHSAINVYRSNAPSYACLPAVKYSCKVQGGDAPFLSSTAEGATFIVAAGHLCPGLLPALRTMKQGETAHVILSGQYAPQVGTCCVFLDVSCIAGSQCSTRPFFYTATFYVTF